MAIVAVRSRARAASSRAVVLAAALLAAPAGAGELPTARLADVGLSAERLAGLDAALVLVLLSQFMVADMDFAGRFQTLAYQAIVD